MVRSVTLAGFLGILLAVPPGELSAQTTPSRNPLSANGAGANPRMRRAQRDQAVAKVGRGGRDFVETMGEDAVAAIFACSTPVAVKLVEFYNGGEMNKLPRPRDLLRVIAQPGHGNDVAWWAMYHAADLADVDYFDAYLANPLEYAMGLKPISEGAGEVRARRQQKLPVIAELSEEQKRGALVIAGLLVIVVGFVLWRRKRSRIY